jgi:ABC-2 type transport system permease protein
MPNLWNACGGLWRISYRRLVSWRQLLTLAWTTAVLALLAGVTVREGHGDSFYTWTIDFYLTALVPIIAFMSGAGAIREDMKPGGVDYLLTRPVPRPAFVGARFLSHLLCLLSRKPGRCSCKRRC